ncbi:hypothetical protein EYC59_04365 [Candidatus Saccharibacteria bacterium]|nr:MAG: hypothetical protein EYC59_04365 [Candidatus Saccharibacteria bacterium]
MAARLPIPGEDHTNWGEILNDFLGVSHTQEGKLKAKTVGASQLRDGTVSLEKLDAEVRSLLQKPSTSLSRAARHDQAVGMAANTSQPTAQLAAATVGDVPPNLPYYAPEDYGCVVGATAAVNDVAISLAIQAAIAGNGIVQFVGKGPYKVSAAIDQDVSKFVVRGNKTVLDVDDTFSGQSFWSLYSSADYQYTMNQGAALSGMVIIGSGLGNALTNTAAIQIGHATYANNSLFRVEDVYIQGFSTGFKFVDNAWRVKLANCRVTGGQALIAPPGLANFGENMAVENCMFESYDPLVTIGTGEWSFSDCSFNHTLVTLNGNCIVKLNHCHLEPYKAAPCIDVAHPQATMIVDNTTLIIDPNVSINNAFFNVVSSNTTYGLIIRNLDTIQSAKYTPQVNSQNCVLVSGGGRVDMQGFSSNVNGYGFAVAKSCNLLYNGDAEKGTTAGWTTYATYGGATAFTTDTAMVRYGSYSFKLATSAASIYVGQPVPCRPGQWVMAQCWNKLEVWTGTANTFISLDFLSAKNEVIQTTGYTNVVGTTWWACRRLSGMTPVAPSGTTFVRVYIGLVSSASATAWYDDIIVNVV